MIAHYGIHSKLGNRNKTEEKCAVTGVNQNSVENFFSISSNLHNISIC